MPQKKRKGQNKHNRQWRKEHAAYRAKLSLGDIDKMTGRKKT